MLGLNLTSLSARALPALTKTLHLTSPFLGLFLVVHLSAPTLATLGGESLSSQTLLLGREYYQTTWTEPLLLLIPLGLHAASGIVKRLLSFSFRGDPAAQNTPSRTTCTPTSRPPPPSRSLTHPLALSALTLLLLLPTHYLTHRIYPSLPTPPILSVGPAELDFSFVCTALSQWPVRTAGMYALLVGAVAVHVGEGVSLLRRVYFPKLRSAGGAVEDAKAVVSPLPLSTKLSVTPRSKRLLLSLTLIALPVLAGVWSLASDLDVFVFPDLAARYRAVLMHSWVYQI